MPEHTTYLEPFFGSGAVLFNKRPATLETVNDIDGDVVNLFQMIRERPDELARLVHWTPYSREEYKAAYDTPIDDIDRARRFLVKCWQSIRVKTGSISGLKEIQIENRPALQVIGRYKREDVLIYADPPYILGTRNGEIYGNEMTDDDHAELLNALNDHPGPVLLSGYANELYDDMLSNWQREERQQVIETGQARTEVLWINPVAAGHGQQTIFSLPGVQMG